MQKVISTAKNNNTFWIIAQVSLDQHIWPLEGAASLLPTAMTKWVFLAIYIRNRLIMATDGRCVLFHGAVGPEITRTLIQCSVTTALSYSIFCESQQPPGLSHEHWYLSNGTFFGGTDVHLNISDFAVVWSGCAHIPWCRGEYIF